MHPKEGVVVLVSLGAFRKGVEVVGSTRPNAEAS